MPKGQDGRPSKAFTLPQAEAVLRTAERTAMYAYIVLSLLIGARTEELTPGSRWRTSPGAWATLPGAR